MSIAINFNSWFLPKLASASKVDDINTQLFTMFAIHEPFLLRIGGPDVNNNRVLFCSKSNNVKQRHYPSLISYQTLRIKSSIHKILGFSPTQLLCKCNIDDRSHSISGFILENISSVNLSPLASAFPVPRGFPVTTYKTCFRTRLSDPLLKWRERRRSLMWWLLALAWQISWGWIWGDVRMFMNSYVDC